MAGAELGLMGAGTLLSAYGTYEAGQAQADSLDAQAAMLTEQAALELRRARSDAVDINIAGRKLIGTQRAAYGASGVDVSTGSPLEVMAAQAVENDLAKRRRLWEGQARSLMLMWQAQVASYEAGQQRKAAKINAAGTLLTGGGRTALAGGVGGEIPGVSNLGYTSGGPDSGY